MVFSCASAKAERSLSSLSCVCVYVDQNKGTPPPHPPEMAFLLEIPWFQVRIWIYHMQKINLDWYQSASSRSRHNKNHVLPKRGTMLKSIPCYLLMLPKEL